MKIRRLGAIAVSALLGAAALTGSATSAQAAAPAPSAPNVADGNGDVIVHLFQWNWNSVADECADFLGPNGFGAVQVSPPQEHVVLPFAEGAEYPWWQDYQAVSYSLDNTRRGTRQDFADMVQTCRDNGVKIYVDAIINHTTGPGSGTGSAGSDWNGDTESYPAVPYGPNDFNDCKREPNNWHDPHEVQNCRLLDLRDLRTGSGYVRDQLTGFLNDMVALGVAGFRVDAAKHIPAEDLGAIYAGLDDVPHYGGKPYIFQEVIEDGGAHASLNPPAYTGIGDVTDFRYHHTVAHAVAQGDLGGVLDTVANNTPVHSSEAVVFMDNHDTQRERPGISYQGLGDRHDLGQALTIAQPYGTPKIMSSYEFGSSHAEGPPSTGVQPGNPAGSLTADTDCENDRWFCEHRHVNGMATFANTVGGTDPVVRANEGSRIAFDRGDRGFAAFNAGGGTWNLTAQTSLPDGTYHDVASGRVVNGQWDAPTYTVSGGQVTVQVPANGAVALHIGVDCATDPGCPQEWNGGIGGGNGGDNGGDCTTVAAEFHTEATTFYGQNVYAVGSLPELGGWNPHSGLPLSTDSGSYPWWSGSTSLPAGTEFEYKYVKIDGAGNVEWESGNNRVATGDDSGGGCTQVFTDTWRG